MTMNILAILLSLAMMLSGAGEGQTDSAFRTLVLHDVSLTYNDQSVTLAPELVLGALTYDDKAVLEVFLNTEDEVLFPIQLGISQDGLTALLEHEDVAFRVSSKAFDALSEQMSQASDAMMGQLQQQAAGGNTEMMNVLMNELIPAYSELLEAVKDPAFAEQLQADGEAVMEKVVDKGEGKPVTEMIEGENYELTEYVYTLDSAKLAELIDTVYTSNDKLSALYNALFKFYGVLPEESGLNDVASYTDLFTKLNIAMTLEIDERVSADGNVEMTDGIMTMDLNEMVHATAAAAAQQADGETQEIPELPPFVMNIHSEKLDEYSYADISSEYAVEGTGMEMHIQAEGEGATDMSMNMQMTASQEGKPAFHMNMDARSETDEDSGDVQSDLHYIITAPQGVRIVVDVESTRYANETSETKFDISGSSNGQNFGLSFCADLRGDLIEDLANGHEAALTIDDFSQETLAALGQDEATQGTLMRVLGSLTEDSQKLMADESVQQLVAMISSLSAQPVQEAYVDDSFEGDDYTETGDTEDYDYDYEEPEDDGVLPYNVPEFTWLPEGWSIIESETDTVYDMVQMTLADADQKNYSYVSLFADTDDGESTNYIVADDGTVTPVEGREVIVSSYGGDDIGVTLRESGAYAVMSFFAPDIDMDTIGKIIAGMKF